MHQATLDKKFTQTYPATTLYWHTCKFTRKRFCSALRRTTYSPEGLRLKKEQDEAIKQAAKLVCQVYFYQCPKTGIWFTTRIPGSRYAPQSKALTHQAQIEYARQHRQQPQVKERERLRSQARKAYRREWERRRVARLRQPASVIDPNPGED